MSWVQPKFSDFVIPPAKKQKTNNVNIKKSTMYKGNAEEIAWLNRYKPKKKSDLVVNKKKIEEIESWLQETTKKNGSAFLLLYGPPGCGKLTTLKVLCQEYGINLVEWLPQVALTTYNPDSISNIPYKSEITLFEDFVMRATRYSNVLNRNTCRVIVVKDIPLQYFKDPSLFDLLLEKYRDIDDINLVFIVTDFKTTRELFSDNNKIKFNIKTIQFNPITQRNTVLALQKIAKDKFPKDLNGISLSSGGDLRNAITTLQFLSAKGSLPKNKVEDQPQKGTIDIFHAMGRILYSKREADSKFKYCPIDLAVSFISTPDLFLNMLQENYLGTFSSIHDVAKASESLAISDILLKPNFSTSFSDVSLCNSSFALMFYNSKPIKKFQQFNRPSRYNDNMMEYRSISKDTESLIEKVSYGRHIPSFSTLDSNKDMFKKIKPF